MRTVIRVVLSGHSLLGVEGLNHYISLCLHFPFYGTRITTFNTQFKVL